MIHYNPLTQEELKPDGSIEGVKIVFSASQLLGNMTCRPYSFEELIERSWVENETQALREVAGNNKLDILHLQVIPSKSVCINLFNDKYWGSDFGNELKEVLIELFESNEPTTLELFVKNVGSPNRGAGFVDKRIRKLNNYYKAEVAAYKASS